MKKLIYILSIVIAASSLYSCSDFLEAEPLTKKITLNYYSSVSDMQEALVACYDGMQYIYSGGVGIPLACNVMGDLCFGGLGNTDPNNFKMVDEHNLTVAPSYDDMFTDNWVYYYKAIYRCNMLILNLGNISWEGNESTRDQIWGEVHFLRAYLYFDMVRLWERVPLLLKPSEEAVPQSEPDEVYKAITNDLQEAIASCSDLAYSNIPESEYGHANKWAAQAMLARVYLFYTGYYNKTELVGDEAVTKSEVLAGLEEIIDTSGYGLVNKYYSLWPAASRYFAVDEGLKMDNNSYAGENNEEVLFSIKYSYLSDYNGNLDGGHWIVMNGLRGEHIPYYGYGQGWGAATVVPELYQNWDENDERRGSSIIAINEEAKGRGIDYDSWTDVKEYTGYFTKKYIPLREADTNDWTTTALGAADFMIGQYQDFFVLRYADVLLMAAELGSANALDYVNQVHTRSGLDPVGSLAELDPEGVSAIEGLRTERMYEFAFEGIRYWDLLRYGVDYAADKIEYQGTVFNGGVEATKKIEGDYLRTTRGFIAIPSDHVSRSGYEQNIGWEN